MVDCRAETKLRLTHMNPTLFAIGKDNALVELRRQEYDSEDLFQTLLADHPGLLTHARGNSGALLLVRREARVPASQDGGSRWSLDHLFLDQDGVPVLVEVKRSSDTRLRREVVGQMLDYAANGVAYWPIDAFSSAFAAQPGNESAVERLEHFLAGRDAETFWRQVESNLKAGRIRMVFVADLIPPELRRIIEFLNEQMRPAEVIAIEVEHFVSTDGFRVLSPRLVGATERAIASKVVQAVKPSISVDEWMTTLATQHGEVAAANAGQLVDWFASSGFEIGMTDTQDALFSRLGQPNGRFIWPFFIRRSTGKVETSLQYLKIHPAFESEAARADLLEKMKALPGQTVTTTKTTGWPSIPLSALSDQRVWEGFTQVALYVKSQVGS